MSDRIREKEVNETKPIQATENYQKKTDTVESYDDCFKKNTENKEQNNEIQKKTDTVESYDDCFKKNTETKEQNNEIKQTQEEYNDCIKKNEVSDTAVLERDEAIHNTDSKPDSDVDNVEVKPETKDESEPEKTVEDKQQKVSWDDLSTSNEAEPNSYRISSYQGENPKERALLNKELPPEATISIPLETSNNDLVVKTDDQGRVCELYSPKVDYFGGDRSGYQQRKSVEMKDGVRGEDDGGHLYPRQWGGPSERVNLMPMDSGVNRTGEWRKMERDINEQLDQGKDVTDFSVKPQYDGSSQRPTGFEVTYKVNDVPCDRYTNISNQKEVKDE